MMKQSILKGLVAGQVPDSTVDLLVAPTAPPNAYPNRNRMRIKPSLHVRACGWIAVHSHDDLQTVHLVGTTVQYKGLP